MDVSGIASVVSALQPILTWVQPLALGTLFLSFIYWIIFG